MRHHHADHEPGEEAHGHDHGQGHGHTHAHGIVDPSIASSDRGLWALKWSFGGLTVTAAIHRLLHPEPVALLWAVMMASLIGFLGNEAVAIFRIRVGRQIGSAALIADGHHARIDGWTSLAVLVGAIAVWAGYPLADPVVGLLISIAIFLLVWQSAGSIVLRALDGVETQALQEIVHAAGYVPGVTEVTDLRARWIGHRLHADLNITAPGTFSVGEGHEVAKAVRHQLLHHLPHLGSMSVHVDPDGQAGEHHHRIGAHVHDGLPMHTHE